MFTQGRIIFALCFILVFIAGLILGYRKDIKERAANYKGSTRVIIIVLALLALLTGLVKALKFI